MDKHFKWLGILDLVSLLLLVIQFASVLPLLAAGSVDASPTSQLWFSRVILVPQLVLVPLLALSAMGHLQSKVYGLIVYYIQFPLRFPALVFTLGFVTYIDTWFPQHDISRYTLAVAVFGELLRLTHSIQTHRRLYRSGHTSV